MKGSSTELAPCLGLCLGEQLSRLRDRSLRATELAQAYLDRIERTEPAISAYRSRVGRDVLTQAESADRALEQGQPGDLLGVPFALKDNMVTQGVVTTAGSRMLEHWVPPYDGAQHGSLREAGGILLGKQNMDEFSMGSSSENTPWQAPKNPWDPRRVTGGSSGGGAASVAARSCAFTLGSDTGGSIRQPAAFCGIVGLKPTYGRVSRRGLVAYASSLDQVGPMTVRVRDAARVLKVIAGHDPKDATSSTRPVPDYLAACEKGMAKRKIGVDRAALEHPGFNPQMRAHFLQNLSELEALGATIVDIELPSASYAVAAYYVLAAAEASSNLARFDGVRYGHRAKAEDLMGQYCLSRAEGFGPEVIRRILLGTFVLRADSYQAYYGRALRTRTLIAREYQAAFTKCDVIASPVSPILPFELGEKTADPLTMYLADVFTVAVNLAGLPAMSVPGGTLQLASGTTLPVGLQLIAPSFDESALLGVGASYEDAHPHYLKLPDKIG